MVIARKVTSVYDPLGTTTTIINKAKVRLQELKMGTGELKWSKNISDSDKS
jgi:hypothetical protein